MKAYHWLRDNMTSGNGSEPPWKVGESRTIKGRLVLCERGYHSSPTPYDGLQYASGGVLCEVKISKPAYEDNTKQVSHTRKLIKAVNVERILHEQACRIAEDVLPLFEAQYPDDKRPRMAIETKRRWLRGEATDTELAAARAAAEAAAEATAGAAGAAWAAGAARAAWASAGAAWASAWAAAWAAAGAAWAAARDAARDAAWAAAGVAARDAAGDAAGAKYKGWLNEALTQALEAVQARYPQEVGETCLESGT